jgi:hypothetical protein
VVCLPPAADGASAAAAAVAAVPRQPPYSLSRRARPRPPGDPSGEWAVSTPGKLPGNLPEPCLGINFARDGMGRKDWLALVACHSDAWLFSVAFFFAVRLDAAGRAALFRALNLQPTLFEIATGRAQPAPPPEPGRLVRVAGIEGAGGAGGGGGGGGGRDGGSGGGKDGGGGGAGGVGDGSVLEQRRRRRQQQQGEAGGGGTKRRALAEPRAGGRMRAGGDGTGGGGSPRASGSSGSGGAAAAGAAAALRLPPLPPKVVPASMAGAKKPDPGGRVVGEGDVTLQLQGSYAEVRLARGCSGLAGSTSQAATAPSVAWDGDAWGSPA